MKSTSCTRQENHSRPIQPSSSIRLNQLWSTRTARSKSHSIIGSRWKPSSHKKPRGKKGLEGTCEIRVILGVVVISARSIAALNMKKSILILIPPDIEVKKRGKKLRYQQRRIHGCLTQILSKSQDQLPRTLVPANNLRHYRRERNLGHLISSR